MPGPVRIALIGNSFAANVQLPALRWAGGNEVIGIAGADPAKARATAEEWSIPHATGHWRDLLALDPDLVLVTTPVHLHAEMVGAALETRAAILCEKPFTLDAQEARALAAAASGRLALLDHQARWSPWRAKLRELLADGFCGEVWHGRIEWYFGSPERIDAPYSWWYDAARGGGVLGALGSHLLDLLQLELGPIAAVRAHFDTFVKRRKDGASGTPRAVTADEHCALWLRMAQGASVSLEASILTPGGRGTCIEYHGSLGALRLEDETHLFAARHGAAFEPVHVDPSPTHEETGMPEARIFSRLLPLYLRDVVRAVARGQTELPGAATFADGLATMRVLDGARRSHAEARWIDCGT